MVERGSGRAARHQERRMGSKIVCVVACVCACLWSCGGPEEVVVSAQRVELSSEHRALVPTSVIEVRLIGTSRLVATSALVDVEGSIDGRAIAYTYVAQEDLGVEDATLSRVGGDTGDLVVKIPVSEGLWGELAGGSVFDGEVTVTARDPFDSALAKGTLAGVTWRIEATPSPSVSVAPSGDVFAGERVSVTGGPFLRPEEGKSWAVVTAGALGGRSMVGARVPLEWGGVRDKANFVISPSAFGVQEGVFEGSISGVRVGVRGAPLA